MEKQGSRNIYVHVYFLSARIKSLPEINLRINPICKYSRERHLGGCIAHARSGSFTTEQALLKPSDILEVRGFLFPLALAGRESSRAFKMQTQPLEREAVFVKSTWAQVAYVFVEAILS